MTGAGRASAPAVQVTPHGAARVASGHPWIFSSDIAAHGEAAPGDTVQVIDARRRILGAAHYSSSSQIALRMLGGPGLDTGREFFRDRIARAERLRRMVVRDTDAYRLVHGEADLLPGLVIDRYAGVFVVQAGSQGMDRSLGDVAAALRDLFSPNAIVVRNDSPARRLERLPVEKKLLEGVLPDVLTVRINGLALHIDPLEGQKTGTYLDQRENYLAAARYARGRALDCFTSTGGFALHLAQACETVQAIDSSARALETARANAAANNIENIEFREANAFDLLSAYASGRRTFDIVVLDPPALAKSRSSTTGALRLYRDLNLRALRLLAEGGILVSCCCSHHVSEAALLEVIAQAALEAGRTLRVLERRTQARDHPILLTVPETHYLKCLLFEVF